MTGMRLPLLAVLAALSAAVAVSAQARAQGGLETQNLWCVNDGKQFSAELQISGCTGAIQSGQWAGKDLSWAFTNRCAGYRGLRDWDRAIADCTSAIQLDGRNAVAFLNRGSSWVDKGDPDRGIQDYIEALSINPRYSAAYYGRGTAYLHKQQLDRAIADFNKTIELDDRYAHAYANRALAYERMGDRERAIADYRKALSLGDTLSADDLRRLGVTP